MQEQFTRLIDVANLFQTIGGAQELRAKDPEDFVRLAYIVTSVLDRNLGAGNRHSAALVGLCDSMEESGRAPGSHALAALYLEAAQIVRAAAREILGHYAP